ncbi:hypothetical protein ACJMK2_000268 [Sinanodonta woodiana]|uniref:SGNH hydrolase-type esterase domain-containing protein n=1 Tax=Sinanodonta woodiana TaxID=1069815 RepID=A0ABD3XNU8_SINWO
MRLLIVGHSIVARLALYFASLNVFRIPPDLQIQFRGVSGAWVSNFFFLNWRVSVHDHNVIFLQVGENDVGILQPDQVVHNLVRLCMMMLRFKIR